MRKKTQDKSTQTPHHEINKFFQEIIKDFFTKTYNDHDINVWLRGAEFIFHRQENIPKDYNFAYSLKVFITNPENKGFLEQYLTRKYRKKWIFLKDQYPFVKELFDNKEFAIMVPKSGATYNTTLPPSNPKQHISEGNSAFTQYTKKNLSPPKTPPPNEKPALHKLPPNSDGSPPRASKFQRV
ncbi:MAG: hypothetical protein AAF195_02760 [Pseudomonadota bacterium]